MSKREKIIVLLMVLSVAYGAYALFFEGRGSKTKATRTQKSSGELDGFVSEIAQRLAGMNQSETGAYTLALAESGWDNDPFLETELSVMKAAGRETEASVDIASLFTYSGYLKMGSRGMAIINGMEYEVGELLEETDYRVKRITPTRVFIGDAGGKTDVVLLLNETE